MERKTDYDLQATVPNGSCHFLFGDCDCENMQLWFWCFFFSSNKTFLTQIHFPNTFNNEMHSEQTEKKKKRWNWWKMEQM